MHSMSIDVGARRAERGKNPSMRKRKNRVDSSSQVEKLELAKGSRLDGSGDWWRHSPLNGKDVSGLCNFGLNIAGEGGRGIKRRGRGNQQNSCQKHGNYHYTTCFES